MNLRVLVVCLVLCLVVVGTTAAVPAGDGRIAEYERRRIKLAEELAAAHCILGKWCRENRLPLKVRKHFKEVLRLRPGYAPAERELAKYARPVTGGKTLNCELRLRSGERIKAQLAMSMLRVQTGSGVLAISVGECDLIRLGAGDEPDVIVANGFHGKARILNDTFAVRGKIGSVDASRETLAGIRIFRPCPVCKGRVEWKCPRCEGTGRVVEKKVCPKCKGRGRIKCTVCRGRGYTKCVRCGGKGYTWGIHAGLKARIHCPYCKATGKKPCPDCRGGGVECPDCHGEPVEVKESVCPDCKGEKNLRCTACGGTGVKPLSPDVEKIEKAPAKSATKSLSE